MSKYYRLSLRKGEDIVPVANEIEHIKAYVKIQNMRFGNRISLKIDLAEEVTACPIIKLILQPIVENAIMHGILEKEEERGTIKISGRIKGAVLKIRVADDGVGIPPQKLKELPVQASSSE